MCEKWSWVYNMRITDTKNDGQNFYSWVNYHFDCLNVQLRE